MNILIFAQISTNAVSRVYPFYKKLSESHRVTVAGYGQPYDAYSKVINFRSIRSLRELLKGDFDIIHVFKLKYNLFLPVLLLKYFKNIPIILDLDDMEYVPHKFRNTYYFDTEIKYKPTSIIDGLYRLSDARTVHTSILQRIYGGKIIRTGADADLFNPQKYKKTRFKEEIGLQDKFLITFTGQPRAYKGEDLIVKALHKLNNKNIQFLHIGPTEDPDFQKLYHKYRRLIKVHGLVRHEHLPEILTITDLVILPHKKYGPWNLAQIPTKLYEAMAMEKPIIASSVGDIPDIVGDSALVFNGQLDTREALKMDVELLAEQIQYAYDNQNEMKKLGKKARNRLIERFNWDILKKQTLEVYESCA